MKQLYISVGHKCVHVRVYARLDTFLCDLYLAGFVNQLDHACRLELVNEDHMGLFVDGWGFFTFLISSILSNGIRRDCLHF